MNGPKHQVGPDTVVHFSYRLFDEEGELVEDSGSESLSFLFGYGQLAPALESSLDGAFGGDERKITLAAEQAFGARDPQALVTVDRAEMPETLCVGDEFEAEHESGDAVSLTVLEVQEDRVVLDANHPLAGQKVSLVVTIAGVRPALTHELEAAQEELQSSEFEGESLIPPILLLRPPSKSTLTPDGKPSAGVQKPNASAGED